MATRATYLLPTANWSDQKICFYVHHDGYPRGAAYYFLMMHQHKNHRSGYAGRFFRAVEGAEFTKNHERHVDTEYRYNLNKAGILTVMAWCRIEKWEQIYQGTWYDFVNQQLKEELTQEEKLYPFKLYEYSTHTTVMSLIEANAYVKTQLEYAAKAREEGWIGNAASTEDEAKTVQSQIDKILDNRGGSV